MATKLEAKDIIEALKSMSMLEVKALIEAIEQEFGVSAAAPVAVAAASDANAANSAPAEVSVVLKEAGPNKIAVIKIVRELTGAGLMEAKAIVDGAPKVIKENVKTEEAEKIKKQFEEAKAVVELK